MFHRSRLVFTVFIVFSLFSVALVALVAHAEREREAVLPQQVCEEIANFYSACGARFSYQNETFHFATALGHHDVPCSDGQNLAFYDRVDHMDIASILMIP